LKKLLFRCALLLTAVACVAAGITAAQVFRLRRHNPRETAFMALRRAELRKRHEPDRLEEKFVPLQSISPWARCAVVVAEDENFWSHHGFDWGAMRRAAETDLRRGRIRHGGSTITQQLAKNLYLSPSRSLLRKGREAVITFFLELELPKRRILELYLNTIELGQRTYGIEAASQRYFGHPAAELSEEEAAELAAMIPSPRIYDPIRHADRLARRRAAILRMMRSSPLCYPARRAAAPPGPTS
jgi:monofunctional glycosyltransferase